MRRSSFPKKKANFGRKWQTLNDTSTPHWDYFCANLYIFAVSLSCCTLYPCCLDVHAWLYRASDTRLNDETFPASLGLQCENQLHPARSRAYMCTSEETSLTRLLQWNFNRTNRRGVINKWRAHSAGGSHGAASPPPPSQLRSRFVYENPWLLCPRLSLWLRLLLLLLLLLMPSCSFAVSLSTMARLAQPYQSCARWDRVELNPPIAFSSQSRYRDEQFN